ncbi:MAG: sigma-70 family RNA polymerase sigma factor [Phycisphaerae bacterium]|nr:sigma-70 family RNA polymerase sigma factor [Phycisphaerae bacterium]
MQRDETENRGENNTDAQRGQPGSADAGPDDPELIERLRDGDGDALRVLMGRYDRLVRYAVFRLCRAECMQDPIFLDSRASEAWTGFVQSVQRSDSAPPKNLKTYLIQIARNKCADALRRPELSVGMEAGDFADDLSRLEAPSPAGVELLIRAEEVLALRGCMEKLDLSDKKICEQLEHLVARRWKPAAEALGMPESTVRSRWAVIVSKLKTCLEKKKQKTFAPRRPSEDS